jgi:GAF domain-containing protein
MRRSARRAGRERRESTSGSSFAEGQARIEALEAELAAARAREAATAEVLEVINSSPGDLAPVFDAMLEKAASLCEAAFGILWTYDGEFYRAAAFRNVPRAYVEFLREPPPAGPETTLGRIAAGAAVVQISDMAAHEILNLGSPLFRQAVELGGFRTVVSVSLRKDGALLGAISVYRQQVRPFTDKQIGLLQNFASQAVIAMENARLITETREALEQQTATAEVLGVINSSPGDLAPVFYAMLDKAVRLCEAAFGVLWTFDGQDFHTVGLHGLPNTLAEFVTRVPFRAPPGGSHGRVLRGEQFVQIADLADTEAYRSGADAMRRAYVDLGEARTLLTVPLRKDDAVLGVFSIYRQEVRLFTEKQIALLQNFAAQAVIAMENARLISETREALEQQTAMAEILRVISSSPTDVQPTFEAIAEAAKALTGAMLGAVLTYDGKLIDIVAASGWTPEEMEKSQSVFPIPADHGTTTGRAIVTRAVAHIEDVATDPEFAYRPLQEMGGHTSLAVPMLRDGQPIGAITVQHRQIEAFSDKQIDLLKTFADQAVIAIENVRLFNELNERTRDLQESLGYQTATSDVLKVISHSDAELAPVLETLVETATRLCEADHGYVFRQHDGGHHLVASFGVDPAYRDFVVANPFPTDRGTLSGRVALEHRVVHIEDAATDPEYTWTEAQQRGNLHTGLGVPLLRDNALIGVVVLYRSRVERFTDKQIALVSTFADQAVIAIENARLLGELRERTGDLEESLEYQTATSDVLQVISRTTFDLQPVLDTLSETAARLCLAELAFMTRRDGDTYHVVTAVGSTPETMADATHLKKSVLDRHSFVAGRETITGRVISEGRPVQIEDISADPEYALTELTTVGKIRTLLGVPLMREGVVFGTMSLCRQRVEAFTEKQVELVRTFADQAVIAIENTRLLTETRETLEQQQAIGEILQVINRRPPRHRGDVNRPADSPVVEW